MAKGGGRDALYARLAREQAILLGLALAYFVTAEVGFLLADANQMGTLIWAPSGIALGAFIILGYRIWPAIFVAAAGAYLFRLGAAPIVLLMAGANTCEGLLAAYLVNRYAGGRHALQNPRNTLRFAGMLLLVSSIVTPTLGTASLVLTHRALWTDYGSVWLTFSLGSLLGMLLIAPPILLYSQGAGSRMRPRQRVEGAVVLCLVFLVGVIVFYQAPVAMRGMPNELLCTPVLLWAAFRLGRRHATAAVLILAATSIFGTLEGRGPFLSATPFTSLVVVQCFLAITSTMTMSLAALGSEYSVAEAQLRELVVTDPLTGLPNYRRLLEVLGTEIARANRYKQEFAVVFFDMDSLKRINDEHGHLIGSRAVCRFAETLRAACRTTDTAARYGGDEFVTVLSETDLEGARVVVRRVEERLMDDPDHPTLSVSAGIAVYPRDGGTPTTLLSAADRALYAAKAEKTAARRRAAVGIRELTGVGSR